MSTPPVGGPGAVPGHPSASQPAPGGFPGRPSAPAPVPGRPRNGTIAWALGFLAYLPIPFLGVIVAGIVQLCVGLAQRRHGGLAAANGVRAANWGLTQLCWPVLMATTLTLGALTGSPGESGVTFTPVMNALVFTMIGLYLVLGIAQLVYAIIGTVQASGGKRVRVPVIPFLRAPRP
jgi:uncharacterized Tic20 family protein